MYIYKNKIKQTILALDTFTNSRRLINSNAVAVQDLSVDDNVLSAAFIGSSVYV